MKKKIGFVQGGFQSLAHLRKRRWLIALGLILAMSGLVYAAYFQSFETDTAGWFGANRVPTGTHGVTSKTPAFHAEDGGSAFTRWGGYSKTFPPLGYTTSIDIYLDISPPYMTGSETPYPNDTRFDWTSAINTPACVHRRDFVFNAGFYNDPADSTGAGPRFVISASNNAGRGNSNPKNPGRMPYTVYSEGWYTFEHHFRDNGGVLAVDLTLKNSLGVAQMMWTLSDPSDVIGQTVGGNRYGWFPTDEFPYLAFDTSALVGSQDYCTPPSTPGAKITGGGWIDVPVLSKGTFGLVAKAGSDGTSSGNVTYQDHGAQDRTVKSTAITSVTVNAPCAQIVGTATVNGTGSVNFQVQVCDNGEPGTSDTFSINMSDGYFASGTLRGGNIQIH